MEDTELSNSTPNSRVGHITSARHISSARRVLIRLYAAVLIFSSAACAPVFADRAYAYDAEKTERSGLIRGDLSTWTQRASSFSQNRAVSITGDEPLSAMGCSYYATFFMLCRMGLMDPLKDTAWQFALECKRKGLAREGTGYFEPRSIGTLTNGRVRFVEKGTYPNYYDGLAAVGTCETQKDMIRLIRNLTEKKGYFLIACAVGTVTNYLGEEYGSEGHYIFIDSVHGQDLVIGDSAFPGTKWSDNWGAHGASIVKLYAYELLDEDGRRIRPSERQSMYVVRSADED